MNKEHNGVLAVQNMYDLGHGFMPLISLKIRLLEPINRPMKIYVNLLELLKDYVQLNKITLNQLAENMDGVQAPYFRRWSNRGLSEENMKKIVEATHIPFDVIIRLKYKNPTLYDVRTRRFETSVFDRDFVNRKVLREEMPRTETRYEDQLNAYGEIGYLIDREGDDANLQEVFTYIKEMYDSRLFPPNWEALVRRAAETLWELNIIYLDPWGYYSGHIVTIPTEMTDLVAVTEEKEILSLEKIRERPWRAEPIILHIFSTFCTHSNYVYFLLRRIAKFIHRNINVQINGRSLLSAYPTTDHAKEMVEKFGLTAIGREAYRKHKHAQSHVPPRMYAAHLEDIDDLIRVE